MHEKIQRSMRLLSWYCQNEEFKGYDPYDGLNSKIFRRIPLVSTNRLARLIWIQAFKRSPWNLRIAAGIKKDYNPKGLGLFLAGYCILYKIGQEQEYLNQINFISGKLDELINKKWTGACWGYNFDWQARAFFQPKNTPTIVASTFISNALLDSYEITGNKQFLATARSACDFILKDLNRTYDEKGNFAFSYSPLDKSVVFNASLLGSRLLARVFTFTRETELLEEAKRAVAFCCDRQKSNGSWGYGTLPFHQWVDNFHTGYNLECISDYMKFSGDKSYEKNLRIGFRYYIDTFFTTEGICKYYADSVYPIDIHAPAQLIITLSKLNKFSDHRSLLDKVLHWTIDNMQSDQGFFYYQINKYFSSKIPYMRWAQAWMFYALATYFYEESRIFNRIN